MLIRLLEFFSSEVGTNYYSFGIQLTLSITLLFYIYLGIKQKKLSFPHLFLSLVVVYLLQLVQNMSGSPSLLWLTAGGMDRLILFIQLFLVFLGLNEIKFNLIGLRYILPFILLLFLGIVAMMNLPIGEGGIGNFNFTPEAYYWSVGLLVFSVFAFLTPSGENEPFSWLKKAFFFLVGTGAVTDLIFVPFEGNHSGFIRLSMIIAFPLLMLIPNMIGFCLTTVNNQILDDFIGRIEKTTDQYFVLEAPGLPINDTEEIAINEIWPPEYASLLNEVKQPLSSILGYTDLLEKAESGELDALRLKYLERIRSAASSIEHRIDEINHLRSIELGRIKFVPSVIDLETILTEAIKHSEFLIKDKQVKTDVLIDLGGNKLIGDFNSLLLIFNIAVENAITATHQGGGVYINAIEDNTKEGHILISIKDEGEGIEPQDIAAVFDKRISTNDPLIKGIGDKGVGLSILKSLVEAIQGDITIHSKSGEGSTMLISLPLNLIGSFQPIEDTEELPPTENPL